MFQISINFVIVTKVINVPQVHILESTLKCLDFSTVMWYTWIYFETDAIISVLQPADMPKEPSVKMYARPGRIKYNGSTTTLLVH